MNGTIVIGLGAALLSALLLGGCASGSTEGIEGRSDPVSATTLDPAEVCAPELGADAFSLVSTNGWFPIDVGWVWVIEGEEDDEAIVQQITILDETEVVAGITTRVLEEREWVDGDLAEVSRNYVVEGWDGTVCYFGEAVDIYQEDGTVSHEGQWRADEPGNAPGILMPAAPRPGLRFATEVAPGVAEDEVKIVGSGPVEVPAGEFEVTIRFREFNPLDPGKGYKTFAFGVGLVLDEDLELTTFQSP